MTVQKTMVLAVDDDQRTLKMLTGVLGVAGYRVVAVTSGEAALEIMAQENPDLVMLDVMMPGMDGCAVCREIREFSQVPIIMVTARGNDDDKVVCLDAGADDFVTKPFSSRELTARVRAVLRRTKVWEERPEPTFSCGNLIVDFAAKKVTVGGRTVDLTATEYRMLSYLARNAGCVVTPDQVLEKVWGVEYKGETHLLQVNMARLRQKLGEDARNPKYILTKHGIGYTMNRNLAPVLVSSVR